MPTVIHELDELLESRAMLVLCKPRDDQFDSAHAHDVALACWSQELRDLDQRIEHARNRERLAPRE